MATQLAAPEPLDAAASADAESSAAASDDAGSSSAAPAAGATFVRLSKAEKKAAKKERAHASRLKQREREREAQKKKVEARRAARAAALAALTPAEREAQIAAERAERDAGYEATVAQSAAVEAALEGGLRVVLDLSYGAHMSAREHNSLQRQLSRCWGANRRAAAPVSLHLAGLAQCPAACLPPGGDHLRWKVHRLDERVEERFPPASLTFLTPDAPDVLGALDPARVYVIGGLVDRSVQKAASLARARPRRGDGAAAARGALGDRRRARAAHARRRADDSARVQCERRLGPRDHGRAARAQAGAPARGGRALGAKEEGRQLELGRAAARGRRRRRRRGGGRGRGRRRRGWIKIGHSHRRLHTAVNPG